MPKTCHQSHQQNMGRARCSPALAAAPTPAVCVANFSWEFLQIRNAFMLLTQSSWKENKIPGANIKSRFPPHEKLHVSKCSQETQLNMVKSFKKGLVNIFSSLLIMESREPVPENAGTTGR